VKDPVSGLAQAGVYIEHHIRLASCQLGQIRPKLRELGVYVLSAGCVWRLMAASVEQRDLVPPFNEALHYEGADEPCPAQHENATHPAERTGGG
jgi:hypothetical protein